MTNYHSYEWIMARLQEHYNEALNYFPEDRIVGIFLQGSQNYGLEYEDSDVDSKLIVVPSFEEIAMNRSPVSTTHVRTNDEHIDFKDIRLYMQTFRKQNLNFLEILFTPYYIINPRYYCYWNKLVEAREDIAHYDNVQALKSMRGIAMEKYHALEHRYPSRIPWIEKFGYDPKQLHHLLRIEEFLEKYLDGIPYEKCLFSEDPGYLVDVKRGAIPYDYAIPLADKAKEHIDKMYTEYMEHVDSFHNSSIDDLLDDVQLNIMREAIKSEL